MKKFLFIILLVFSVQALFMPAAAYAGETGGLNTQMYDDGAMKEVDFFENILDNPNNINKAFQNGAEGEPFVQSGFSSGTGNPHQTLFFGRDNEDDWSYLVVDTQAKEVSGYIKVETSGTYYFAVYCDDGCEGVITIGGSDKIFARQPEPTARNLVFNNNGLQLEAGVYYPIKMKYFNQPGPDGFLLNWQRGEFQLLYKRGAQWTEDEYVKIWGIETPFVKKQNDYRKEILTGRKIWHVNPARRVPDSWLVPFIDVTVPVITFQQQPEAGLWTNRDVKIIVSVDGTGSAVKTVKWAEGEKTVGYFLDDGTTVEGGSFSAGQNGVYTVYAEDTAGNEVVKTVEITNIDKLKPTIEIRQVAEGKRARIFVTADGTGSDIILEKWSKGNHDIGFFNKDNGNNGTVFEGDSFLAESNGEYTVYVKDAAGNEEVLSFHIDVVDSDALTIALIQDPPSGTWTRGNVTINVEFSCGSGGNGNGNGHGNSNGKDNTVQIRKWAPGVRETAYFASNGIEFSDDSFTVSENDTYTVYGKTKSGEEAVEVITIGNIDRDVPVIDISSSVPADVWTNQDITVSVSVDDMSGLKVFKWVQGEQDESFFAQGGTDISGESFKISENGTYTVYAEDCAGNSVLKTIVIGNIDKTPPVISLSKSPDGWTNGDVTINASIDGTGSAVVVKKWAAGEITDENDNIRFFDQAGTAFTGGGFDVSINNTYTVYARDEAGNEAMACIEVDKIDTTCPTFRLEFDPSDFSRTKVVTVTIIFDDDLGAGIEIIKWAKDKQDSGYFDQNGTAVQDNSFKVYENGTYTVYIRDEAGNMVLVNFDIQNIYPELI